jgi:acetylornithine deacetylase
MLETRVLKAVEEHRQGALNLLQSLVRVESISGNEKECQDLVIAFMRMLGLEMDVWDPPDGELGRHPAYVPTGMSYMGRPNVVGRWPGSGGGRSLILNGHIDVVPPGPEESWTRPPWSGELEEGKVYGRGTADMKGGIVTMLLVVSALQTAGVRLQGDIILQSVVDEEYGGNGTLAAIMRGYRADACVFTEATGLGQVAVANRGAQFFRIRVPGQAGGTEYKHDLVNPIAKAFEVFQAVEAYSIMRESVVSHPLYDADNTKVPTGVTTIQAGEWPSTVSSQCVMEGTIECLPGEDIRQVAEAFRNYLMEWSAKDAWFRDHPLEVEWFGLWFDAAAIDPDHSFVQTLGRTVKRMTGTQPSPTGAPGCDLRLPILYGDTPAVRFGPSGGPIHSIDEYVEFEEVLTCAGILALTAIDWCGLA